VEVDRAHAVRRGCGRKGNEVIVKRMDAAWSKQTADVEPTLRCRAQRAKKLWLLREAAIFDRGVDPRKLLRHALSRPDVQVSDLAVPHLALRESDSSAAGVELGVWPTGKQAAPGWHCGSSNRVS
jgi:hypothetical protein